MFLILLVSLFLALPVNAALLPIGPGEISKIESFSDSLKAFPLVKGINLEGDEISIPADLEGKKKLLLVAFKRKQQEDVNTWLTATRPLLEANSSFSVYELPTIKKMNFLIRLNINNGMRYGIDSKTQRLRTVTLYLDKERFKALLGINTEDQIYAFLLDENNEIIYRRSGLADSQKIKELEELLD